MKYTAIVTILLSYILVSCESTTPQNTFVKEYIKKDSLTVCKTMDELPYSVRFVKLNTSDKCILSDIKKIEMDGTDLFIEDFKERVYRFDIDGRFHNIIATKGGSQNEYVSLSDFYLDNKNKSACIMDLSKGKLLRYDYNGSFLSSQNVNMELMNNPVGIAPASEHELIAINCNGPGEEYQYSLVDMDKAVSKQVLPYTIIGEERSIQENGRIAQNSSTTYFLSFLSDTIYSYSDGNLIAEYLYLPDEPQFNKKDVQGKKFQTCFDAEQTIRNHSISTGIKSLYATDTHLFFAYATKDSYYRIFFNNKTNKGYIFNVTKNLDDVGNIIWNNVMASSGQAFIGVLPIGEYMSNELLKNKYPAFSKLLSQSNVSDNPILTFIEIQE